jgi:hypothetical protein
MQVQAVKLDQGWYIKNIPGFEDVKSDVIDIEIELTPNQNTNLDYKELSGISIMERYFEKRQRESQSKKDTTDIQEKFQNRFDISTNKTLKESLKEL